MVYYLLFFILITIKIKQVINKLKIVGILLLDCPPPPVGLLIIVTSSGILNIYPRQFISKIDAPNIRIKPAFGGLYGINKPDDQRGVSTTVSYSLPQISIAWREYQIQNANYMNIFNRGIQKKRTFRRISEVERDEIFNKIRWKGLKKKKNAVS